MCGILRFRVRARACPRHGVPIGWVATAVTAAQSEAMAARAHARRSVPSRWHAARPVLSAMRTQSRARRSRRCRAPARPSERVRRQRRQNIELRWWARSRHLRALTRRTNDRVAAPLARKVDAVARELPARRHPEGVVDLIVEQQRKDEEEHDQRDQATDQECPRLPARHGVHARQEEARWHEPAQ